MHTHNTNTHEHDMHTSMQCTVVWSAVHNTNMVDV